MAENIVNNNLAAAWQWQWLIMAKYNGNGVINQLASK